MKVKSSLKSLKGRHRDCKVVRRRGRVFVINKTDPRFKAKQGQACAELCASWRWFFPSNTVVWLELGSPRQHSRGMRPVCGPAHLSLILAFSCLVAACGGSGGDRELSSNAMLEALSEGAEEDVALGGGERSAQSNFSQDLLDKLKATESSAEAANLEEEIWEAWLLSGSPTVDMLMLRGVEATETADLELARDMFDRAIRIKPDYAEAWNRRALLFFNDGHYDEAISDLEVALTHEPRHFGAWTGLGMIFESIEEPDAALRAYRKVLEIHPHAAAAKQGEARLIVQVEGRSLQTLNRRSFTTIASSAGAARWTMGRWGLKSGVGISDQLIGFAALLRDGADLQLSGETPWTTGRQQ